MQKLTTHFYKHLPRPGYAGEGRNNRKGFTMMELMLTIGILAVALAMVSALFPVAVIESNQSYKDVVGTLICENGLTVAKTMVKQTDILDTQTTLKILAAEDDTSIISQKSQHYQELLDSDYVINGGSIIDDDKYKLQGFLVLGRKVNNSNQLVIVSYARNRNNMVTAKSVSCNVAAGSKDITGGGGDLIVGSPLIDAATGYYATITSTDSTGTTGTLDRPITASGEPDVTSAFVIQESGATKSPALSVLVTLTGLE